MSARTFALVAAGGTGGHVFPAVAVAESLVTRGHAPSSIRFVTESRELSTKSIARAGFEFDVLPLQHGLRRRLSAENFRVLAQFVASLLVAWRLLRRHRPQIVIGFGAYVSLPVVVVARLRRVPVVVHEQNGHPGIANRIAVALGARPAVSLPGTPLRGAQVTGNPVRPAISAVHRNPQTPPLVVVTGGSLGSELLNTATLDLADRWATRRDVAIRHVTGTRFIDECVAARADRASALLDYSAVGFEHDMAALYSRAAVLVGRSGGMVAELCAAGVPSVLVPWSGATGDHQGANARILAEAGAAVVVPEAECGGEELARVLDTLLADPAALAAMSDAARGLGRPEAADAVATLVEATARP